MFKKNRTDNKDRIRSEMQYRRVRIYLQNYIKRCQKIADEYMEKGKQAAKVGDTQLMRQFAVGYGTMIEKRLAAEKILLSIESMNLNLEQDEISKKFLEYARIFEGVSGGKGIREKDYENMLKSITERDMSLTNIMDAINDRILLTDKSELDEIMSEMKEETKGSELEKKLDRILEMMKEQRSKEEKGKNGETKRKKKEGEDEDSSERKMRSQRKRKEILEDIEEKLREIEKYT